MAVPKTTETSCRDGSVQARQVERLHKQPHECILICDCVCTCALHAQDILSYIHIGLNAFV